MSDKKELITLEVDLKSGTPQDEVTKVLTKISQDMGTELMNSGFLSVFKRSGGDCDKYTLQIEVIRDSDHMQNYSLQGEMIAGNEVFRYRPRKA